VDEPVQVTTGRASAAGIIDVLLTCRKVSVVGIGHPALDREPLGGIAPSADRR
jgi:hypothetical protein